MRKSSDQEKAGHRQWGMSAEPSTRAVRGDPQPPRENGHAAKKAPSRIREGAL